MRRVLELVAATALTAALVAACSFGESDPTYPLPAEPITVGLPTQSDSGAAGCPQTDLGQLRIEWDSLHRALSLGGGKFAFPSGYAAREMPSGRLEILAPDGTVVARDGATLQLNGADLEHICRVEVLP
jgi:hypothetical protein